MVEFGGYGQWQTASSENRARHFFRTGRAGQTVAGMVWRAFEGVPRDCPPAVFVHGMGNDGNIWAAVVSELLGLGPVLVVDLPGYGRSVRSARGLTLELAIRGLSEVLRQEGISRPVNLIGHSLGGIVAAEWAAKFPSHVSRLLLVSAPPLTAIQMISEPSQIVRLPRSALAMSGLVTTGLLPLSGRSISRIITSNLGRIVALAPYAAHSRRLSPSPTRFALNEIGGGNTQLVVRSSRESRFESTISRIACPIHLVRGSQDVLTTQLDFDALAEWTDAVQHETQDSGHLLPIERPAVISRLVAEQWDSS